MKVALLGCSGWVGSYLTQAIKARSHGTSIVGTYANNVPTTEVATKQISNADIDKLLTFLEAEKVNAIVNLTRGEIATDFVAHQKLIEFANTKYCPYYYCSSFNACDAQLEKDHLETEKPNAQREYGKFKAKCEEELTKKSNRFAVFRFSATHGWAPNRAARTEEFLQKLKSQKTVTVHRGIIQNRTAVTHLTAMMAAIIDRNGEGIFHLGTVDSSDEIDFLRRLARAFGYASDSIIPGETSPTNANMVPEKILKMFGKEFELMESDTLLEVSGIPDLHQYRAPA